MGEFTTMTMHLEGPWLSTTGKKRGPRKWASSEAKKLSQQRSAEWDRKLIEFEKLTPKCKDASNTILNERSILLREQEKIMYRI